MKKVSLILAALALVLGISQCKKQEEPVASGEKQHIVLNASFGGGNSKIADPGNGELIWSRNDVIKVYNSSETEIGTLECTDAANGIFEGDINETTGNITFTFGSDINYLHQTGELNKAISLTAEAPYDKDGNYSVTMNMMDRAVVKLDLSKILTMVGQEVNFSAKNGLGVTLFIEREDFESPFYVAIPAPNKIVKVNNIAVDWNLEPNSFYTAAGEGGAPTGEAIVIEPATPTTPKFTVDANGKTVEFAPGNLYWDGSAFKFEENQWDFRHYKGTNYDAAVIGGESTTTPEGTVGSFFWSKTASVAYAASYSESGTTTGDVFFTNASDFQVNGETAGTWHTLSNAEWDYLLGTRDNASSLRAWVTLSDVSVSGLVILPDGSSATASDITTRSALADAGAVFLPAAGLRYGTGVYDVGSSGYYWSGTPYVDNENFAYHMYFDLGIVLEGGDGRRDGYAVRLVR